MLFSSWLWFSALTSAISCPWDHHKLAKCFQGLIQLDCSPHCKVLSFSPLPRSLPFSLPFSLSLCSGICLSITINELFCRTAHHSQARSAVPFAFTSLSMSLSLSFSLSASLFHSHTPFGAPYSRMTSMRLAIYNLRFKANPFASVAACPIQSCPIPHWQGH